MKLISIFKKLLLTVAIIVAASTSIFASLGMGADLMYNYAAGVIGTQPLTATISLLINIEKGALACAPSNKFNNRKSRFLEAFNVIISCRTICIQRVAIDANEVFHLTPSSSSLKNS